MFAFGDLTHNAILELFEFIPLESLVRLERVNSYWRTTIRQVRHKRLDLYIEDESLSFSKKDLEQVLTPTDFCASNEVYTPNKLELAFNKDAAVCLAPKADYEQPSTSGLASASAKANGWLNGIMGCLRPVFNMVGKKKENENKPDDWEIPFDSIRDLQWLGSGAQGAVFLGRMNTEMVAVKKVKEKSETEIRHLRKLNHPNIVTFKGVCTVPPCFCIIMEYCPYGQLYDQLKNGKRQVTPILAVEWSKQIASGMYYLHSHKIIHRDLKSPNVLITHNDSLKITDFGTSRQWNDRSTKMSFAGTVAWMAPEVIRNELCSEKVDVWSFGVVLWELLTSEIPYKDVDSSAVIWGVGNNSLHLPVPSSCPNGFKLLLQQCWSVKARNRPSFRHILMHIDIAASELVTISSENYLYMQKSWKEEIRNCLGKMKSSRASITTDDELLEIEIIKKRNEELKHAQDIRKHYERKLEKVNDLYMEVTACLLQLEQRERNLNLREESLYGTKARKHLLVTPLIENAQERANLTNGNITNGNNHKKEPNSICSFDSPVKTPSETPSCALQRSKFRRSRGSRKSGSSTMTAASTGSTSKSDHRASRESRKAPSKFSSIRSSDDNCSSLSGPEGTDSSLNDLDKRPPPDYFVRTPRQRSHRRRTPPNDILSSSTSS